MKFFKRPERNLPRRRQFERLDETHTFRRGRTLTGSVSSLVRSSSETGADLKSPRVHTHELKKIRRRVLAVFVAVILITAGFYVLVSQFTVHATVQASPDPSFRLDPMYAETIDDYLKDHLSERWRLFTNVDQLTSHLQAAAPEVKSVTMRGSSGFGKSLFEVVFREPIASWDIGNKELYVDAEGIPFTRNYFNSPTLRISDRSGMTSSLSGQSVMSNRFMGYVGQVIGIAKERGYTVSTIVIPEGMTRQVQVHLKDVKYYFKFSSDRSARGGVEDMVKAIDWMNSHQVTPEYVDVRVGGKVFYK